MKSIFSSHFVNEKEVKAYLV